MSDAPDAVCPAYDALSTGLGTLARAQALQERYDQDAEDHSRVIVTGWSDPLSGQPTLHPPTEPAPPREPPSRVYQRLHEELSQFIAPDAAEDLLDGALHAIGVARASAESLDFREALVEIVPERLALLLPEASVASVLWALEGALVDVHRRSAPY
ncbi:MAG: hypothetical protein H5U40_10025 [Polyangiaceae bacterium]|nr:hypothetical protein [Polyangiaceae bacterium]